MAAPQPRCSQRPVDQEIEQELRQSGWSPMLARFLAGRLEQAVDRQQALNPQLAALPHPDAIPDMQKAVERICQAVINREKVVFAVDHDMDGQASAAVLWTAFTAHFLVPAERLAVVSSHRLREGYGITMPVVDRICDLAPGLVISADKGSSDEERIAVLAAADIDVIVTDHHAVPDSGPPPSAYACVNPTRKDSEFDPTICGAAVAFFCMARVRSRLLEQGQAINEAGLTALLDYVAVATIADCVALRPDAGATNRTLVHHGLARINAKSRPCWEVFCEQRDGARVDSQAVGFQLAPAVAAAGRLDWADVGFDFLTAPNRRSAERLWSQLQAENSERKQVEKRIRVAAIQQVESQPLPTGIAVFLEDGHSGVHGITASRLVERYGRPAAVFAPRGRGARGMDGDPPDVADDSNAAALVPESAGEQTLISGSFRSVPGLHMRDALQRVEDAQPDLLCGFGGHAGAAGASLLQTNFPRFAALFDAVCAEMLEAVELGPQLLLDGDLQSADVSLDTVDAFAQLDPWGRDFPLPQFAAEFEVVQRRAIGDGSHLKLQLADDAGGLFDAVWFFAREDATGAFPLSEGERLRLVYRLQDNLWRGKRSLQLQVIGKESA